MTSFQGWNLYAVLLISSLCFLLESANALHCHVCSSDTLEPCSTFHSPGELPTELCPVDVTSCYTKIKDGITVRGCISRNKQNQQCVDNSCLTCRSNNCNAQIFPEDRLSCMHCEGSSCVNQTNTVDVRYPCAQYTQNDSCYSVFSSDGSVAYRGCMSDFKSEGREYCIQNFAQCNICSKRACNSNPLEFEEKLSCIKCDPDENSNCNVIAENATATECTRTILGYKNECYTYTKRNVSHRGCLYEANENIFKECTDIFSESCLTCNQTNCNRDPIASTDLDFNEFHYEIMQDEGDKPKFTHCGNKSCTKINSWQRSCIKCDSTTNPNCATEFDPELAEFCPYAEEDLGCFHMVSDKKVIRGCVVELNDEEKEKCFANDDTCKTCFDDGCNRKESFLQCYVTDEPYKSLVMPYYTKASPKLCAKYDDQCFIQLLENDTVIRGCIREYAAEHDLSPTFLSDNVADNKYQLCSTPLCNQNLEPIYCQSCNSSSNPACTEHLRMEISLKNQLEKQCPLEAKSSGCYHAIRNGYVERGCMSELDEDTHFECKMNSTECKSCVGNNCNDAKNFTHCLWSDHADYLGVSRLCHKYNDPCITHASNDLVLRGCFHDWIDKAPHGIDITADCEIPSKCEKCYSDNCNNRFDRREYCLSCSSSDNNDCKLYPNKNMRVSCPFSAQKIGCYHRLEALNNVQRGCASGLTLTELSECQSTNSTCKLCVGDSCNKKSKFPSCVECSSNSDDDDCIANTVLMQERQCAHYSDQCYIRSEDGIIIRNCTDNKFTAKECEQNPNCQLCSGNGCNGKIIEPEICIICDSSNDPACNSDAVLKEESYVKKCPLSLEVSGCFHYMDGDNRRHIRGCAIELSKIMEPMQTEVNTMQKFRTCKGSKCNSEPTLPNCLVCDSTEDPNCAFSPNSTHNKVCDSYQNKCFTLISGKSVVRGCLKDIDNESKKQCENDKSKCAIYASTDIVGPNRKRVNIDDTCIRCDSNTDRDCWTKPEAYKGHICERIDSSRETGCYLSIVGDHLTRGCIQDLNTENATNCLSNSDTCKSCKEKDCNSRAKFQECYSCSSQSDPLCARNVRRTNTEVCKSYHSNCVTGVDRYGYIHRRCAEPHESFEQEFSNQYEICLENKCNGGVYPSDALQCYQCTEDDKKCDLVGNNSLKPEPCSIASIHDQCFTYLGPDKKIFRGCLSDSTNARLLCELVDEHKNGTCIKCNASGCNNQPKFKPPKLSCINCTDSEECAFGLESSDKSYACEKLVVFGDNETCFTHSISGTEEVKRGCTLDVVCLEEDWCREEDGCTTCSGSNCNIQNARYSWCVRCESGVKGSCSGSSKLDDYISQCERSPYPFSKRGCFTSVKDGNVTRGCISDLSEEEHTKCRAQKECTLCIDDNCNKDPIPNSSTKISTSIFMLAPFLILVAYIR